MADRRNVVFVDLTEDGEREYEEEFRRIVDLTREDSDSMSPLLRQQGQQYHSHRRLRVQRNPPLDNTHRSLLVYDVDGTTYRVDDFLELKQPIGEYWKSQFIEIKQIWVSASGNEVLLRGLPYSRLSSLHGRFERCINEVCQIIEIYDSDNRPDEQQAMVQVRPGEIAAFRSLHKTNTDFRSDRNCRYGNDSQWTMLNMGDKEKMKYKQKFAPLTCRWQMRSQYQSAAFQRAGKAHSASILHLFENDVDDPAYRIGDEQRRRAWLKRHPTATGRQRSSYNFGDAFCGAGGATSGAIQGGLKPTIAIDFWRLACDSYQRNFPQTTLFRQDVHDFIARTDFTSLPRIDVLHISPPCQFYSPAKVQEGKDDEQNEVALWACGDLIEKIRPRIFTMEQTFGLCAERFRLHFNKLIQGFTMYGYSVQWQERVDLDQYGLPQKRQRLIILGAAPGEQLPPWPAPTHGSARRPWVTEGMAIGNLPHNLTLHDIWYARRVGGIARVPNVPLSRTICCGGPQGTIHYNGERDYTLRELAILQGFLYGHMFVGTRTQIKKQIGNAFPASVAKVFFGTIRKFLERQDRNRMSAAAPSGGPDTPASGYHYLPNNRRRTLSHSQVPGYSRLNGGLGEDEALQTAMRESRRERRNHAREVITISDSDEDNDDGLHNSMSRLSVQPMFGNQRRRFPPPSPRPLSAASSLTLGNSPSPSPSPRPSPGPSARRSKLRKHKSDDTPESARRKRTRDVIYVASDKDDDKDDDTTESSRRQERVREVIYVASVDDNDNNNSNNEAYYEGKITDRARARAAAREETASLPPREDEGRSFTIRQRKWMGKLPVTRDQVNGWEF